MMSLDDLDGLYRPLASHSEHQRSNHIRYYLAGKLTGMIIWVCTPAPGRGLHRFTELEQKLREK